MTGEALVAALLAGAVAAYLIYTLLRPEKF
jgi:K+-transporting ATPase KdpF subunit